MHASLAYYAYEKDMAYSKLEKLVLIQILCLQSYLNLAFQDTGHDGKAKNTEHENILQGTFEYDLSCIEGSKPIWQKNGQKIAFPRNKKFDFTHLSAHEFPILCVDKEDEGIYTCHAKESHQKRNTTNLPLKRIVVQVSESDPVDPCGKNEDRDLIFEDFMCPTYLQKNYPCCKTIPVPAESMNVEISSGLGGLKNKCDIYSGQNSKNPWNALVSWKLNSFGTYGTWGWQIKVLGLGGDSSYNYCVQINSKDKFLNWTIPADNLAPGAKYNITLQTLPEGSKSNSRYKIVTIPSWQDTCEKLGGNCTWEICLPVENVTVSINSSSSRPLVSWRPSPFYKTQHVFEVMYRDENNSDSDKIIVQNEHNLVLNLSTNLNKHSHKYFVEVTPIFLFDDEVIRYGRSCKEVIFYVTSPNTEPTATGPDQSPSYTLKIIIAVCVTTAAIIIAIFILRYYCLSSPSDHPTRQTPRLESVEVLLVHDGHCELCNRVTHLLAIVLNETGRIKCCLDLCSTQEIAEHGLGWYQKKFVECEKIVIVCTKESQKTCENQGGNSNIHQSAFRFIRDMIIGDRFSYNNNNVKVVPVCFDYSTRDVIPCSLRDRQSFSLPSESRYLKMCLSGLSARTMDDVEEYELECSSELQNQLENAISSVQRSHCGHSRNSLVNYVRSLSCSSTGEPSRV